MASLCFGSTKTRVISPLGKATVRKPAHAVCLPLTDAKYTPSLSIYNIRYYDIMTKKKHVITNKGGRPRIPDYKKNSVHISIKVPPALDAYITEQAITKYKGKRCDYIRAALWGRWVRELVTPEFNRLLHDLSNMGNNVKYLRDWFFRHGMMLEGTQCQNILSELAGILDEARHRRRLSESENAEAMAVTEPETDRI